jgi:predicted transcriptional regulator YheO
MRRASRLLASLADPDGEDFPPGESEPHLGDALNRMIAAASAHVGVPTFEMSRSQKQQVVRYLDERGAFLIKKAVEQVARELGVSRFTIYNYLEDTNRRDAGANGAKQRRTASEGERGRS